MCSVADCGHVLDASGQIDWTRAATQQLRNIRRGVRRFTDLQRSVSIESRSPYRND